MGALIWYESFHNVYAYYEMSLHYVVHFKYVQILFVNYISIKLEKNKQEPTWKSWPKLGLNKEQINKDHTGL